MNGASVNEKELNSENEDLSPPIAIFLSAESFLKSAEYIHDVYENKSLKLRFDMPIYYLYCHALELTMKAFLRTQGMSNNELRNTKKWGHNLLRLWGECLKRGLTPDYRTKFAGGAVIRLLDPFATEYEFRYVKTGSKTLPTLEEVRDTAEGLLAWVRPICEATVPGPIPERGNLAD